MMKSLTQFLVLALLGTYLTVLSVGCASTSSGGKALTFKQTSDQVEDAMLTYRNASIAGALTTAQREGIQAAYKNYKTVYHAGLAKAGSDANAAAPLDVRDAGEQVVARVSALP